MSFTSSSLQYIPRFSNDIPHNQNHNNNNNSLYTTHLESYLYQRKHILVTEKSDGIKVHLIIIMEFLNNVILCNYTHIWPRLQLTDGRSSSIVIFFVRFTVLCPAMENPTTEDATLSGEFSSRNGNRLRLCSLNSAMTIDTSSSPDVGTKPGGRDTVEFDEKLKFVPLI